MVTVANERSMVLGYGLPEDPIVNDIENSLMIGLNSDIPTFFIGSSNGIGTIGKVGIGTTAPTKLLEVNGTLKVNDWSFLSNINMDGAYIKNINEIRGQDGLRFRGKNPASTQMILTEDGKLGIGTLEPDAKLQVNGDIFIDDAFSGLILKSPDGQCWKGTIDDDGGFAFESIDCNLITGKDENPGIKHQLVDIFPNPAGNKLYILLSDDATEGRVAIYNEQGVLLQKRELNRGKNTIPLKKIPKGVLIVKVFNTKGELLTTEKVMHF